MRDLPGVPIRRTHTRALVLLLLTLPFCVADLAARPTRVQPAATPGPPSGTVDDGRRLFIGQARLRNGGPPCGSCHSISSLPFPGGGLVGPDLSGIAETLGPEGTDVTLQTLFFPTMMPLYEKRPLTPTEQRALKAFLLSPGAARTGTDTTWLAALAAAGFVVLIGATWLAWRRRLRGVRAPLVASLRR